jgi:N-methylhydantoinase B
VPRKVLGDIRAQLAACHICDREIRDLARRMGADRLRALFVDLQDYAERLAREQIAAFPDGTYAFTDVIDDDGIDPGPIPITVAFTVEGDRIVADFAGSAPQVKGAINCAMPFTKSAVYACLRCLMDPGVPTNSGFFRCVEVRAPEATIVNPVPPAPVAARGLTGFRLANVLMGALAKLAPERVPACEVGGDTGISIGGYHADRSPFVFLEFLFGAWGGRPDRDGIDGCASIVVNFSNNPVEVLEAEFPLEILRYEFVPDTGGPGEFRGGLSIVREYRFTEAEGILQIRSDRHRSRPYGLAGGEAGAPASNVLNPGAEARTLPSKTLISLRNGDVLRHTLAGAGGYGDPRKRDPRKVLDDVRNGKVSIEAAARDYGVVVDPSSITTLPHSSTRQLASGGTSVVAS